MSWMIMHGFCISCNRIISFNPERVPSLRVDGEREPLCQNCFGLWNEAHRVSKGLEPIELKVGAYEPEPVLINDINIY